MNYSWWDCTRIVAPQASCLHRVHEQGNLAQLWYDGVCRVIALAQRRLPAAESNAADIRALSRSKAEEGLQLVGFAVLSCPLKPESAPALEQLRHASHQLVMITGDAALTACHAAASVGITDRPTLILSHR